MSKVSFPKNFCWGAATSAHQVEGGNFNDWTEWEKENAEKLAQKAKNYWQSWQKEKFPEMFRPENYISGRACEHYHRYQEDFDIAKSLHQNVHRFSIEWSRIEPAEGSFNQREIEHYQKVIQALYERSIEPFVTLYHWPLPLWLVEKGGVLNRRWPLFFKRYVQKVSAYLKEVKFWITINEPNVYTLNAYRRGIWPPQKKSFFKYRQVLNNLAQAHSLAYRVLHQTNNQVWVGITKNNVYFKNIPLAGYFWNCWFLDKVSREQDFIGLNYYFSRHWPKKRNLPVSDMGWQIYPEGIYYLLKALKKYKKPIYITENGLADADDSQRENFIKSHLYWIHKAISRGVDVRGYFYWSLLDNFEWDKGFWPRFGLVEIDYQTMTRKIRPSAYEYAKICQNNTLEF